MPIRPDVLTCNGWSANGGLWTISRFAIMLALLFLPLLATRAAEGQSKAEEYQLKAAFLFRFAQFVEWPSSAGAEPMTFCVAGKDPFHGDLESGAQGKSIAGKAVRVRYLKQVPDARECQVVFVQANENERIHDLISAVSDVAVLTVGESEDFLQQGGIIRFCIEDRKLRFEINQAAAQRAHLNISSRLLMLAIKVTGSNRDQ